MKQDYIHEYKLKNIVCEFIVGARGILSPDCREMVYKKQQNNDIIKKYFIIYILLYNTYNKITLLITYIINVLLFCRFNNNDINVLITSEVLEEGIDIQTCNYVIRYDSPKNFPSYVQSKGRARSPSSQFIIMVPNQLKFKKTHSEYNKMEEDIEKVCLA